MYIQKLTINNFRSFKAVEVELNYPGRPDTKKRTGPKTNANVNLFLGGNGTGKSSVFKAAILGVLAPVLSSSGFQADYLVRRAPNESLNLADLPIRENADIRATLQLDDGDADLSGASGRVTGQALIQRVADVETIASTAVVNKPLWERIFFHDSPAFFIVAYGANRRTERPEGFSEQSRSPRYQRVSSLFEDHVGMVPFTYGYLQLRNLSYLGQARYILNQLLPDQVSLTEQLDSQQRPLFDRRGTLLPFDALSDGFRAFTGWVWDLLYQIALVQASGSRNPNISEMAQADGDFQAKARIVNPNTRKLSDMRGVVIIDEIDLFLHPEWQLIVVEQVAQAFPHLQFFFSTHSPLVAGTLEQENIFVLEQDADGSARVAQYRERIHGLTANQILTSSFFRLQATRAPGTGTLNDLARRETADRQPEETGSVSPLPEEQKAMLERLIKKAGEHEAALVRGSE